MKRSKLRKTSRLATLIGLALTCSVLITPNQASPYLASGVKIGEVDQSSAIVWVRLSRDKTPDFQRLPIFTEGLRGNEKSTTPMPSDILQGTDGRVRLRYWVEGEAAEKAVLKDWVSVDPNKDFIHQFHLSGLHSGKRYLWEIEACKAESDTVTDRLSGTFRTAPADDQSEEIRFVVTTCQAVRSIDSGADGHVAYQQMARFDPHFFVHTGDIVYYDKEPIAQTVAQARAKWNLMFAYGHNRRFHQQVSSYFMKDDHDTLKNDCWPGQTYGELTFAQGLDIFREQVPMGRKTYRTIRWGKDVQIWLTENRDFRSSNKAIDGPDKTILGAEQKQWLIDTIAQSDATFKFLITPGPIIGPDKPGKADNHANDAFAYEGQELRDFLSKQENTFVICGDRHWQYCSQDPDTGLLELGCGPINDEHNYGGNTGFNETYHRFFSGKGGFLGITVTGDKAKAEWFTADQWNPNNNRPIARHKEYLP